MNLLSASEYGLGAVDGGKHLMSVARPQFFFRRYFLFGGHKVRQQAQKKERCFVHITFLFRFALSAHLRTVFSYFWIQ